MLNVLAGFFAATLLVIFAFLKKNISVQSAVQSSVILTQSSSTIKDLFTGCSVPGVCAWRELRGHLCTGKGPKGKVGLEKGG